MQPDHSAPLRNTLVFGCGECGKTTFAIRYVLNQPWTCAFIFDLMGQWAIRLKQPWLGTAEECNAALARRVVVFNPHRMFAADKTDDAFNWFCDFVWKASQGGPGRKILVADDAWGFSAGRILTPQLANIVKLGRFYHLEYFGVTHRPSEYHINVRSQVTEWVAFDTLPADVEDLKEYWPGVSAAVGLPKYEFIAFNRNSRSELRAKLPAP